MIRKPTLILLIVFAILLGGVFYLEKNPLPGSQAKATPSATAMPNLLPGWTTSDINTIELKPAQGSPLTLSKDDKGAWTLTEGSTKISENVEAGKVEQIRSQILDASTLAVLPADYALDPIGLKTPENILTVRGAGKQTELRIGKQTPTENGYYIQVDGKAPVVADKYAVDGFMEQLKGLLPTPTPPPGSETTTTPPAPTAAP